MGEPVPEVERATDIYDPRHPHEPEVPPTFDDEGRCLVCKGLHEATERAFEDGIRRALMDPLWLLRGNLDSLEFAIADHIQRYGQHLPGVQRHTTAGVPTAAANMAMSVIRKNVQRIDPPRRLRRAGRPVVSDDLRYFGPDNHADWCPGDPAHEGPCLDVMLAKVDDDPAPMKPSATIGVTARIRTAKRGRLSEPEPTPSGEQQRGE